MVNVHTPPQYTPEEIDANEAMINGPHQYQIISFVIFLALVAVVGIASSRRRKEKNALEYFLGAKGIGPFVLGPSLFVTAVSSLWLLHSSGLVGGIGVWAGVVTALFVLGLGFFVAPLYLKAKVFTVPQFLSCRFDNPTALLFSGFSILFSVGVRIPLTLTLAMWSIERLLGWDMMTSVALMVMVMVIGLYTIVGGFMSVIRTHLVQASVVILGSLALLVLMLLVSPSRMALSLGTILPEGQQSISWITVFIGLPLIFVWQWFADQYVVQRILGSRDTRSVQRGTMFAAMLILVQVMILVALGSATGGWIGSSESINASSIVKGTASMAFLALIMATLASDFHSAATLFTMDFYRTVYPDASDESLVLVGRLSTTMIVILAILAISMVPLVNVSLISLMRQVPVHVAPPIVAVFVFGIFWQRTSSKGALWALVVGELFGGFDLVLRFIHGTSAFAGGVLDKWGNLDLVAFGMISLIASSIILVTMSLFTETRSTETNAYISVLRRKQS